MRFRPLSHHQARSPTSPVRLDPLTLTCLAFLLRAAVPLIIFTTSSALTQIRSPKSVGEEQRPQPGCPGANERTEPPTVRSGSGARRARERGMKPGSHKPVAAFSAACVFRVSSRALLPAERPGRKRPSLSVPFVASVAPFLRSVSSWFRSVGLRSLLHLAGSDKGALCRSSASQ
jgi:hypothetical protein